MSSLRAVKIHNYKKLQHENFQVKEILNNFIMTIFIVRPSHLNCGIYHHIWLAYQGIVELILILQNERHFLAYFS